MSTPLKQIKARHASAVVHPKAWLAMLFLLGGFGCARPAAQIEREPFTLVMLPDTQRYSEKRPDLFFAQTEWIKQNREAQRIVFVTHVGDLVQNRSKLRSEWEVADQAMAVLDGVVPYGVALGNHDYDSDDEDRKNGIATMFLEYFQPDRRFQRHPGYGGASPNGLNTYFLFSGGGVDFIILHLEVEAPDDTLQWAHEVLAQHAGRAAIISTHTYLRGKDGVGRETRRSYRRDGNPGERVWDKFVRRHPQVFMVLCGHVGSAEEYYQISQNDAGGSVLEILADYQGRENGGDGWLRLIRFDPHRREIQIRTYSPALDRFERDENSEFILPWVLPVLEGDGAPKQVAYVQ